METLQHFEVALWAAVVLIPVIYYVNGPAVSNDQWYVRAGLIVIAYLGAPIVTCMKRRTTKQRNLRPDSADESVNVAGTNKGRYHAEGDLVQ
ncbi:MAG: hypothetical protein R3C59_09640 [Planctomycetaceae bacterium]